MLQRRDEVATGTAPAVEGAPRRAWSIRTYLVTLVLASTVPVAIVAGYLAYHFVSESVERTRLEFSDRLRLLRNAVDLRIMNIAEDLEVLALSPALRDGNLAEFRRHAIDVSARIGTTAIVLADLDHQLLFNTRIAEGTPLPRRRELEATKRLLQTGRTQVSDLVRTTIDNLPIITIDVPVHVNGQLRYIIVGGLSPSYLSDLMKESIPRGMVGSIVDRKGILIGRRADDDNTDLIGQPTIPAVRAHVGEDSAMWIKAISRAGIPTYTSLLRSDTTGWSVNLAIPRDVVDGPINRTLQLIALLGFLTLALSLLFARLIGMRFLHALSGLERNVMTLGRARYVAPRAGTVAEVNRMETVLQRVGHDIVTAEAAIEHERSLLRATVETMPIGVLVMMRDGRVSLVNQKMLSLWGVDSLDSIEDRSKLSATYPDGSPYPKGD